MQATSKSATSALVAFFGFMILPLLQKNKESNIYIVATRIDTMQALSWLRSKKVIAQLIVVIIIIILAVLCIVDTNNNKISKNQMITFAVFAIVAVGGMFCLSVHSKCESCEKVGRGPTLTRDDTYMLNVREDSHKADGDIRRELAALKLEFRDEKDRFSRLLHKTRDQEIETVNAHDKEISVLKNRLSDAEFALSQAASKCSERIRMAERSLDVKHRNEVSNLNGEISQKDQQIYELKNR